MPDLHSVKTQNCDSVHNRPRKKGQLGVPAMRLSVRCTEAHRPAPTAPHCLTASTHRTPARDPAVPTASLGPEPHPAGSLPRSETWWLGKGPRAQLRQASTAVSKSNRAVRRPRLAARSALRLGDAGLRDKRRDRTGRTRRRLPLAGGRSRQNAGRVWHVRRVRGAETGWGGAGPEAGVRWRAAVF